ncbi:MAG TPA: NAD(P)-dependent oxidoreductase [Nitrospiraceae bacterium]|nr:NAD(P)-dependent oxidoreductase [Nitrospiraceae bacterium]
MTIALLGTGLLGRAVAGRLQSVGHAVTVYNRTTTKALPLQACGVTVVTRPEQAIAQADCVVLMLADAAAIRAVLLTPASLAALHGKTVIQMGTIAQAESLALQTEIEQVGGSYCEAPVLGSIAEAQAGTLLVMVGGTEEQFVQWGPLFGSLGLEPRLIGPAGKAASLKLALNQLIAAEISAFALSLGMVQRAGVPVDTFMAILRESTLFAQAFEKKLPRLLTRDYQHPNFSTRHLLKDAELFLREASGYALTTSSLEGIRPVLERTIAQGLGDSDYSAIFEVVNPLP